MRQRSAKIKKEPEAPQLEHPALIFCRWVGAFAPSPKSILFRRTGVFPGSGHVFRCRRFVLLQQGWICQVRVGVGCISPILAATAFRNEMRVGIRSSCKPTPAILFTCFFSLFPHAINLSLPAVIFSQRVLPQTLKVHQSHITKMCGLRMNSSSCYLLIFA
jgi:hypothetical protein